MPTTGAVSVLDIELVDSIDKVASRVAGFWANQLLIFGAAYHRREPVVQREQRAMLRRSLETYVKERLVSMETHELGEQWFINHLSEPYPPLARAVRGCKISSAQWSSSSSMSIVYRDGVFHIRTKYPEEGRLVDGYWQGRIKTPALE